MDNAAICVEVKAATCLVDNAAITSVAMAATALVVRLAMPDVDKAKMVLRDEAYDEIVTL